VQEVRYMLVSLAEPRHVDQRPDEDAIRRAAFPERLKAAMARKGWGLSETARQASQVLGPDAKFGRAHVWHYLHGKAMPRARQLRALSRALELEPHELLRSTPPSRSEPGSATMGFIRAHDQGDGTVLLEATQRVSWETAHEIMRVLATASESDSSFG
jgi:transcriptional regulator with XRE-family HTH domain